ncbi:biopolymer transporter ExbD [Trinickia sp. Y13]|uniref:ExbD/TolR family protein n=1 Tax=Trinickia sp. Y13 TaxID=2917807 RepID=UPI002405EBE9|nr:biopolymer transporter ExbD [Trinickia sp. Y13]MDG0026057.1 biopolymer transporter ExbD [Trinickia sp. Y13]
MDDFSNLDGPASLAADINMTPLIDVMLVLLVVFMVTLPVLHHAAKIALPQASSQREDVRPPHVNVEIDALGQIRWDGRPLADTALAGAMSVAAKQAPQPEIRLVADRMTRYERVATVLSAANRAGLAKVGFITDPGVER